MSPAADETKTLEQFLAEPRTAILATIRGDGHPQMTLNWFYWDGSRFFVSTTRTRKKYPNVRRDPRVQIAINDSTSLRAVLVDGHAEILEDVDEQLPYMMEIAKKYERIPEFIQLGYAAKIGRAHV